MEKIVDGIELLRMVRDGEKLPNKIYLEDRGYGYRFFIRLDMYIQIHLYREEKDGTATEVRALDTNDLLKDKFIIEDEEIDIDSIEEIDLFNNGIGFKDVYLVMRSYDSNFEKITDKYNELIKAMKQINKKLEEK